MRRCCMCAAATISVAACGDNLHIAPNLPPDSGSTTPTPMIEVGKQVCTLQRDGSLWCFSSTAAPTQVPGTFSSISRDFGGDFAVRGDGTLYPTTYPGAWSQVSDGNSYTCAVRVDGSLWCLGNNDSGQLGFPRSQYASSSSWIQLPGTSWTSVVTNTPYFPPPSPPQPAPPPRLRADTCATQQDGSRWCWGADFTSTPTFQDSGSSVSALGGTYRCEVRIDGTLECDGWLCEDYCNTPDNTAYPMAPTGIIPGSWATVSTFDMHACAVTTSQELWCWGRNDFGELGDTTRTDHTIPEGNGNLVYAPVQVPGRWEDVSVGPWSTCALDSDDHLWCWGATLTPRPDTSTPNRVTGSDWTQSSAAKGYVCAVRNDGTLWCWGSDIYGELGNGAVSDIPAAPYGRKQNDQDLPVQVGIGTSWASVSAGEGHACARAVNGTVSCWGAGYLSTLPLTTVPTGVPGTGWVELSTGSNETCATKADGTLWCWGNDDVVGAAASPMQIPGANWSKVSVAADNDRVCATRTDGSLWCWGVQEVADMYGGATEYVIRTPTQVPGSSWSTVSAGQVHACAIQTDSSLWCWGMNDGGQLGDGTTTYRAQPTAVGGTGWSEVSVCSSTFYLFTCAVKNDGTLWCWGTGPLGGGATSSTVPIQVDGTGWTHVSADITTCATKSDGSLWCWGGDWSGEIGTGADWSATPTRVF